MKKKVLVIDDSPFVRRMLGDWIKDSAQFELVGTANDGKQGLEKVKELQPDVVTLDVEMPVMDGLTALGHIMAESPVPVLMVSSVTTAGAEATVSALEAGAFDFVTKPSGPASLRFLETKEELFEKLAAAKLPSGGSRKVVHSGHAPTSSDKVLLIGCSTGGPKALTTLFSSLPKGLPVPMLIVQHMPAGFTAALAKRLDHIGTIACKEAADGDKLIPGLALLAPGGRHMSITEDGRVALDDRPAIHGVRPAVDLLFTSAAQSFGQRCVAAVLTGMGRDGADGALDLHRAGAIVLGECESSCVVYGMPKAAKEVGGIDDEVPIEEMGAALVAQLSRRKAARAS